MSSISNMLPRLIGFIVIVITLALAPSIYTANLTVVNYTHIASFTAMSSIAGYGGFLAILGLLITQGIFAVGNYKQQRGGWASLYWMIGSVVALIIILNLFSAAVMPAFYNLITAATAATDTIGSTVFAVLPIVLYLGVIIGAMGVGVWKSGGGRSRSRAASYN